MSPVRDINVYINDLVSASDFYDKNEESLQNGIIYKNQISKRFAEFEEYTIHAFTNVVEKF